VHLCHVGRVVYGPHNLRVSVTGSGDNYADGELMRGMKRDAANFRRYIGGSADTGNGLAMLKDHGRTIGVS